MCTSIESKRSTFCLFIFNYIFKYWNTLALDGSNWQSINLKTFQRDVDVSFIKYLIIIILNLCVFFKGTVLENLSKQCGPFLKRLNIENCKHINDHNMR